MAIWSVAGNKVTLTLESGDTGVIQQERTFGAADGIEADGKHTFYLEVNPDSTAVEAFLQVVGGDLTTATVTGSQELTARGYANGSADITVRFGVRHANLGGGGGGGVTFPLDYANAGAAAADGWSVGSGVVFNNGHNLGPYSTGISIIEPTGAKLTFVNLLTGLTPGTKWRARLWAEPIGSQASWRYMTVALVNGNGTRGYNVKSGNTGPSEMVANYVTVAADGKLDASITTNNDSDFYIAGFTAEPEVPVTGVEVEFDNLTFCVGSGISDPVDPGDPGDEDPPVDPCPDPPCVWPPPPVPLTRWFGIYNGLIQGIGPWNLTHIRFGPKNTANVLRVCEENDTFVSFTLGPEPDWLVNGVFSETRWRSQMQALYDDPESRNAIEAASVGDPPYTKVRCYHQVFDEPFHPTRYGVPISFNVVERCCQMSKQLFPNLETNLRVDPTDSRYVRRMAYNDSLWGEYHLGRGPIDQYIVQRKAAIEALSTEEQPMWMYMGLHYKHFEGASGPSPRYITPAELRYYGRDRIAKLPWIRGFGGWRYEAGLWAQTGFEAAVFETRDEWALSQP